MQRTTRQRRPHSETTFCLVTALFCWCIWICVWQSDRNCSTLSDRSLFSLENASWGVQKKKKKEKEKKQLMKLLLRVCRKAATVAQICGVCTKCEMTIQTFELMGLIRQFFTLYHIFPCKGFYLRKSSSSQLSGSKIWSNSSQGLKYY